MKKRLLGVLLAVSTVFSVYAQNVQVLGYFPQYRSTGGIQFDKLTDIAYSFINPNWDGSLKTTGYYSDPVFGFDMNKFTIIKDGCANAGTNLWVALGGADKDHARDNRLGDVSANSTYRVKLATDLVTFCENNGVYGISVDWEFPDGAQIANHVLLLEAIDDQITAQNANLKVSVAVGGEYKGSANHLGYVSTSLFTSKEHLVDEWHVMAYDFPNSYNANHSSLADAEGSMDGWKNKGMAYNKMLLGVPFYGRDAARTGEKEYDNLLGSASSNYASDNNGTYYYNGKTTLEAKIDLAVEKGARGILIWDLGQDRPVGDYSLLDVIDTKVNQVCPISKPNLGADKGVCAPNSVTLDPGVTGSGLEFTWTKDGGSSSVGSNQTLSVSDAGTYKVSITNGSCTKEDEIVIVSGSSVTVQNASGCDDESLTLSVNSPVSGKTYKWYNQATAGDLLETGTSYSDVFSSSTTIYVEEAADGVDNYTTSPIQVPDKNPSDPEEGQKNYAWAGGDYTYRCAQMIEVEKDLSIKSLRILASAKYGITFNVKVIDAKNPPNFADVTTAGPFTSPADGTAATWAGNLFDFDVNIDLEPGTYLIYVEPTTTGDNGNYGLVLNHTEESVESGVYDLKGSTFQASEELDGFPNFNAGDIGQSWWTSYGPFFNWKIETGANASCGRTEASVTVTECGPPEVTIVTPTANGTYINTEEITFEVTATDGSAVTNVVFEVYKGASKLATIATTKDGTSYAGKWTPTTSGDDYTFKVIATDDDDNDTEETVDFDVDFDVSTASNIVTNSVKVYPSPATDNFNVAFELGTNNNVEIIILNSVGALVQTENLSNQIGTQLVNISTRELNNGLYYVKVKAGNNVITKTINVIK
jgi:GH18 family chitinase